MLAGEAITVTSHARNLTWTFGAIGVLAKENEIVVFVEKSQGGSLFVHTAKAFQEVGLPPQTIDLSRANPAATQFMELSTFAQARSRGDFWEVKPGGHLTFQLRLPQPGPVTFSLGLPGNDKWFDDLADVLDDVMKRVQERVRKLQEDRYLAAQSDPAPHRRLEEDIADLMTYSGLHRAQIDPALRR